MFKRIALIAAALAALLAAPAYAAADAEAGGKAAPAAASDPPDNVRKESRSGDGGTGNDLVSCKRDADGMRGPQRSRFMTRCLKERR